MHALYELQQDLATRLITSIQSVQQVSSQDQMYAIILRVHGANGAVVEGTFFMNSFPQGYCLILEHLILSYLSHSCVDCT